MRSMELVGRERMEVAVSLVAFQTLQPAAHLSNSNNSPFGENPAMMMFRMSRIRLEC